MDSRWYEVFGDGYWSSGVARFASAKAAGVPGVWSGGFQIAKDHAGSGMLNRIILQRSPARRRSNTVQQGSKERPS